ncbi:MAG: hypothetical protein ABSH56_16350 [Bryobacteraceae bacterium]|jgi:hypothetical protein
MTRSWKVVACAAALAYTAAAAEQIGLISTVCPAGVAASGTIQVNNAYGEVNVEGWDRPDVEVTVTRSVFQYGTPQEREAAQRYLNQFRVNTAKAANGDLMISTILPSRNRLIRLFRGWGDFTVEYRIQVPFHSRLRIREGKGDVVITDVAGDIDARAHVGDILVQVPQSATYQVDARCRFGGVYSDLPGTSGHASLFGRSFRENASTASHRLFLRVGAGGVSVQQFRNPLEPAAAR